MWQPLTSIRTSTVPARLYSWNDPADDSVTATAFGTGGRPGLGFGLDPNGSAPSGQNVSKVLLVALTAVTLRCSPTASEGTVQLPFAPVD